MRPAVFSEGVDEGSIENLALSNMNFYPVPPTLQAEVYVRIPDESKCIGKESEWRGGFASKVQNIFLEGPVADDAGNLYVVDIPYGRILRVDKDKNVNVCTTWDGEPNGLAGTAQGDLLVADYKQVRHLERCVSSRR